MRVIVTGATGLIGRALSGSLLADSHEVVAVTRNPQRAAEALGDQVVAVAWDGKTAAGWGERVDGADAVVNLAGESIAGLRWTVAKKRAMLQSRLDASAAVVEAVRQAKQKPRVVLQASAIGIYGPRRAEIIDEAAALGHGFLAGLAWHWEHSVSALPELGVRTVWLRTGIVLSLQGGALPPMVRAFKLFAGGTLGGGDRHFSWIHLADEVAAIRFLLARDDLGGRFNLVAPHALPHREFCRVLGRALRRPNWLPAPAFALRLLLGELADQALLTDQRVVPKRLLDAGFTFRYPDASTALAAIVRERE
jgi:uncharacterized protein (TIGR01777 family)